MKIPTYIVLIAQLLLVSVAGLAQQSAQPPTFQNTRELGQYLADKINEYDKAINKVASQPDVVKAIQEGDIDKINSLSYSIESKLPESTLVRLYPDGADSLDYDSSPACGYTCAQLIESSEDNPPAEALLYKTEHAQILIVKRIKNKADKRIGSIAVHYPYDILGQAMSALSVSGPYIELNQSIDNKPNVLASLGEASIKQGPAGTIVKVAGTPWSIHSWAPGVLSVDTYMPDDLPIPLPYLIAAAVALLLIMVIFFILRRKRGGGSTARAGKASPQTMDNDDESAERTLVFGGGATDVDVSNYLKEDDITDIKNKLED